MTQEANALGSWLARAAVGLRRQFNLDSIALTAQSKPTGVRVCVAEYEGELCRKHYWTHWGDKEDVVTGEVRWMLTEWGRAR